MKYHLDKFTKIIYHPKNGVKKNKNSELKKSVVTNDLVLLAGANSIEFFFHLKIRNLESPIRSKYNSDSKVLSLDDQVLLVKRSKIWVENKLRNSLTNSFTLIIEVQFKKRTLFSIYQLGLNIEYFSRNFINLQSLF